jgi:LacI family transcriptional regulator
MDMKHPKNRRATIKQVAAEAGVSSQTVSRVINNRPDVLPETRERVQQVITRLGYHPNAIARSLIRRRSDTLGVVASGLEYYGPSHTLIGIEQGANQMGYSIFLNLLHQPEIVDVEMIVNGLIARQVEGIIWAVPEIGENHTWFKKAASRLAVPIIFHDMRPDTYLNQVGMDNKRGGQIATEHLIAQGYRKIGLLTGPLHWWSARERRDGWEEALKNAGISIDEALVAQGDWSATSGELGLYQLVEKCPDLEAVFACNDQMALGMMRAARRMGRRIPEDLAVVGFDDIPEAAFFNPALTTMKQDLFQLGSLAVSTLIQILKAGQRNETVPAMRPPFIQPELVVRESSSISSLGKEPNPIP